MARGSIQLSKRYGVNASVAVCYYCGRDTGDIVLPGKLKGDLEAPRRAVWTNQPCPTCEGWMKTGILLICVKDGETGVNPLRTGHLAVVTEDAIKQCIGVVELQGEIIRKRVAFIPDSTWDALGLPRAGKEEVRP